MRRRFSAAVYFAILLAFAIGVERTGAQQNNSQPSPVNLTTLPTITKGTQGSTGVSTQDLKDAGRNRVLITADRVTPATSETAITFTKDVGGTATTAQTSYTVTTGKTLRVQALVFTVQPTSTTAVEGRVMLREGASCGTSSTAAVAVDVGSAAAVANTGVGPAFVTVPDGLEFPAATVLCLTGISTSASATFTVSLVGYEY